CRRCARMLEYSTPLSHVAVCASIHSIFTTAEWHDTYRRERTIDPKQILVSGLFTQGWREAKAAKRNSLRSRPLATIGVPLRPFRLLLVSASGSGVPTAKGSWARPR